ncbi:hypothetical protein L218DRAFT_944248 [Marasmius fiardii PR-910]|nr:hypothetical protein L218DRAFT_944248 [Marasmius fiardii PR-910]
MCHLFSMLTLASCFILTSQAIALPNAGVRPERRQIEENQAQNEIDATGSDFSCSYKVEKALSEVHYSGQNLTRVNWTAAGSATCNVPVSYMSFKINAVSPSGVQHVLATGYCSSQSQGNECMDLHTDDLKYACQQSLDSGSERCDGNWSVLYDVEIEAWEEFDSRTTTESCKASGKTLKCSDVVGTQQIEPTIRSQQN